ncbi:hypothetical protein KKF81_00465 [Candidatus Micrarchaeota archaeon]|nr:hypothetical protein [Candidatus Micrarchaeota archaeon]MBU1165391.1 hypothetical protein [Candidatus Micrarchaeota archaeon]MBU1886210.1 hypothetical protein [Candidatus Micrarchaeota archaeon]
MKTSTALIIFALGTIAMMAFYSYEIPLFIVLGIGSIAALAIDKWKNLKRFLIALVVGGICENTAVALGAWNYTNAAFIFTPLWLPVGWGMSTILLEEAFSKDVPAKFSKRAIALAFGGTLLVGINASHEFFILGCFAFVTIALFALKYYKMTEIRIGIMAAIFGTVMESVCIISGNWQYSAAMFWTPLWLPLCWFNAFLIMRRVIRIGEK